MVTRASGNMPVQASTSLSVALGPMRVAEARLESNNPQATMSIPGAVTAGNCLDCSAENL